MTSLFDVVCAAFECVGLISSVKKQAGFYVLAFSFSLFKLEYFTWEYIWQNP